MQHEMQHVFNQAPNLWVLYAHLSGFESRRLRSLKIPSKRRKPVFTGDFDIKILFLIQIFILKSTILGENATRNATRKILRSIYMQLSSSALFAPFVITHKSWKDFSLRLVLYRIGCHYSLQSQKIHLPTFVISNNLNVELQLPPTETSLQIKSSISFILSINHEYVPISPLLLLKYYQMQ